MKCTFLHVKETRVWEVNLSWSILLSLYNGSTIPAKAPLALPLCSMKEDGWARPKPRPESPVLEREICRTSTLRTSQRITCYIQDVSYFTRPETCDDCEENLKTELELVLQICISSYMVQFTNIFNDLSYFLLFPTITET